jgi:hypothetical protein
MGRRHEYGVDFKVTVRPTIPCLLSLACIAAMVPPPVAYAGTNRYYFAATVAGESEYSVELPWTNVAKAKTVTLAWNPVTNATGYRIYVGRASRTYTEQYAAGASLSLTVPLAPTALTNFVVDVTTTGATNLARASGLKGPWLKLNKTTWRGTNEPPPLYFRAMKKGSKVFIRGWWQ